MPHAARQFDRSVLRQHDNFTQACNRRKYAASIGIAIAVAASVSLWKRATSFEGIENLIDHHASIEGDGWPCPDDLLRLSAGLEDTDDLYFDLNRALAVAA
jgi:cystathionine beta-lyase/cystathionine gamma-synthase